MQDFAATANKILREIDFGESKSSKTAFFVILEGFEFCWFSKFQP